MIGIYLSGTGNTKHCLEKLFSFIAPDAEMIPLESKEALEKIRSNDEILLAYPTQFSNVPYMVKDFITKNKEVWKGKRVFCMTTMGAFAGDSAGCAARILKKFGAEITGGLQIKMPDSVCDSKMLKKPLEVNQRLVREADARIERVAREITAEGKYPKEGLSFFAHLVGLFGQRLWFYGKTKDYSTKLKINDDCVGCGLCAENCPMGNLTIQNGKALSNNRCAMCYRCISLCPKKAITLLGKEVYEQCRYEKFISPKEKMD
ncbi:MAG: EFR1 family ferrodoxin [Clostridiales bacterium]|nr:EFR1 family ferrodoxin [Clostridiales bacterium]